MLLMELRLVRLLVLLGVAAFSPPPATFARVAGSRPRASADDDVDAPESYEAVCAGPPARLDAFLAAQFPERTRREWAEAIGGGAVRVNGAVATRKSASVAAGDGVAADALAEPAGDKPVEAEDLPLDVLVDDASFLVVNKAAGMVAIDTGRTHQIRVHLAHVGSPVLGDPVYGDAQANARAAAAFAANRTLLHAWRLAFDHPDSGARVEVTAPPPPDLARATAVVAGRDG
ncbi:pseudouridine synthase [Aureococcus anophagefferens]|nr:pseudouridine synthase [Aureococcus anophagefferens]